MRACVCGACGACAHVRGVEKTAEGKMEMSRALPPCTLAQVQVHSTVTHGAYMSLLSYVRGTCTSILVPDNVYVRGARYLVHCTTLTVYPHILVLCTYVQVSRTTCSTEEFRHLVGVYEVLVHSTYVHVLCTCVCNTPP